MPVQHALYTVLESLAKEYKPRSYLEIGVQEGHSLERVLCAAPVTDLVLCDTWGSNYGGTGKGSHVHIEAMLALHAYAGSVKYLDGDSKELVPTINRKFDMILVDGDHSATGCLVDMRNAWKLLNDGGIMIVDDLDHPQHAYLSRVFDRFVEDNCDACIIERTFAYPGVGVLRKVESNV